MKVSFRKDVLLRLLELAQAPIKRMKPEACQSHILVQVKDGLAKVSSVGHLEWMTFVVPVDASDGQMTLALSQQLITVVRELGREGRKSKAGVDSLDRVVFDDAKGLSMKFGGFTTKLTGQVFAEPLTELVTDRSASRSYGPPATIEAPAILRAIEEVRYAMFSTKHPDRQGVNIYRHGANIAVQATDGMSLARVVTAIPAPDGFNGFMISDVSLGPVLEILSEATEFSIAQCESAVVLTTSTPGIEDKLEMFIEVIRPAPSSLTIGEELTVVVDKAKILSSLVTVSALRPEIVEFAIRPDDSKFTAIDRQDQLAEVGVEIQDVKGEYVTRLGVQRLKAAVSAPAGSSLSLNFGSSYLRVSAGSDSEHFLAFISR